MALVGESLVNLKVILEDCNQKSVKDWELMLRRQQLWSFMRKLEVLVKKRRFVVKFTEKVQAVITASVSLTKAGWIRYVVVLKVNSSRSKFEYFACRSQETQQQTQLRSRGIEVNDQSFEVEKKFCYLGDTIGAR